MRSAQDILAESTTIAVVGASRDPHKVAHTVPPQIMRHRSRVNPLHPCYPTLADIPVHVYLDNVFRPAADCPEIARQAVEIGADALWLQQDIISAEAREIAVAAGLDYVEDRCTAVERAVAALSKLP